MDSVRKYLVNELRVSGSLDQFDLAEALLVMYDAGVVTAIQQDEGEPLFVYNHDASDAQQSAARATYTGLQAASNDVWNHYVFRGECS